MPRLVRPDAVLVQAVIAGALSFAHLHDLAEAAGQHGWKAWAYPVSVDLLLVAAWHRLRSLRDAGSPRARPGPGSSSPSLPRSARMSPPPACSTWATFRTGSGSSSPDGPRSPSSAEHSWSIGPRRPASRRRSLARSYRPWSSG